MTAYRWRLFQTNMQRKRTCGGIIPASPGLRLRGSRNLLLQEAGLLKRIIENLNKDGVDRRGFLQCMAWAGTGAIWTVSGGVLSSKAFGQMMHHEAGGNGEFSFDQISDSHVGYNKEANKDVPATLQEAIAKT